MTRHSVPGLHHVTAIAGDPQRNHDFYTETLGLRLLKRTVNFDDTSVYHLYYGNEVGTPGTSLTFFPYDSGSGRVGAGQVAATTLAVPAGAVDYWRDRFEEYGVDHDAPTERFGRTVLSFRDPDGLPLELVVDEATDIDPWADGPVPVEHAIRGFGGVALDSTDPDATAEVLELLGYERTDERPDRERWVAASDRAPVIDLLTGESEPGRPGAGTVHHVAVRAENEAVQREWQERLRDAGQRVTEIKDRRYFESIYFREPGGVLFEIATDGPGFDRDQDVEELGSGLSLPPWLEDRRDEIEAGLPPLETATSAESAGD